MSWHTAVVGSDTSAFTAAARLADLAKEEPGPHAVWIPRRGIMADVQRRGEADHLPACRALGLSAKAAVKESRASAVTGFRAQAVAGGTPAHHRAGLPNGVVRRPRRLPPL